MKARSKLLLLLFAANSTFALAQNYPLIETLSSRNVIFQQYQEDVEQSNMAAARGKDYLVFYEYIAKKDDTPYSIYSRCSINLATLASINGIENYTDQLEGKKLVLPSSNGLFIPHEPVTPVEILMAKQHSVAILSGQYPTVKVNGKDYYFLKGMNFSAEERSYFTDQGMYLPLTKSVLTSSFGMRISPITGQWKKHNGVDMAAPLGTPVFSCKKGTVSYIGDLDPVYGNYVVIDHGGGMTSTYCHLKDFSVTKGDRVNGGQVIGHVGLTGATTGPHLHFEIKINGNAKDPQLYLK